MQQSDSQQRSVTSSKFDEEILRDIFPDGEDNHNVLWAHIAPDEAAFIRKAVVRGNQLDPSSVSVTEAYLRGVAVTLEAVRRQQIQLDLLINQLQSPAPARQ